jgi:hypothetical protein
MGDINMETESNKITDDDCNARITISSGVSASLFEEFMAHEIAEIKKTGILPGYVKVGNLTNSINLHSASLTENGTF